MQGRAKTLDLEHMQPSSIYECRLKTVCPLSPDPFFAALGPTCTMLLLALSFRAVCLQQNPQFRSFNPSPVFRNRASRPDTDTGLPRPQAKLL